MFCQGTEQVQEIGQALLIREWQDRVLLANVCNSSCNWVCVGMALAITFMPTCWSNGQNCSSQRYHVSCCDRCILFLAHPNLLGHCFCCGSICAVFVLHVSHGQVWTFSICIFISASLLHCSTCGWMTIKFSIGSNCCCASLSMYVC